MGCLRLFLAAIVMLSHIPARELIGVRTGGTAVSCFFIISGFYMALLLANPLVSVRNFYLSRALRIYPLYWLVGLVSFYLYSLSGVIQMLELHHYKFVTIFAFNNITLFGQDILRSLQIRYNDQSIKPFLVESQLREGYVSGAFLSLIGQSWSLALELMFYLLAPFLLRLRTVFLAGLCIASYTLKMYLIKHRMLENEWANWVFPAELMFFLGGAIVYRFYNRFMADKEKHRLFFWLCVIASSIAAAFLVNSLLFIPTHTRFQYWSANISAAIITPCLFSLFRANKVDRWIGNLSYPLYITHQTVKDISFQHIPDHLTATIVAIAGALLVSIISYHLIDKPIDNFRHKRFPTH